jgi:hypothetical protein
MGKDGPGWPSAVVAIALIALVGVMFWAAVDSDNFSEIWAAVGTIVGVLTGAIPAYFFRKEAAQAEAKASAIAAEAPAEAVDAARRKNPTLW